MTRTDDAMREINASVTQRYATGDWKPKPGDVLYECEFLRAGFRSWSLEAPDKAWKLTLSKLDFGAREPSALLTVHAPQHQNAFPDLDWLVLTHSIGTNGGTNFNQVTKRLTDTLGSSQIDWARRVGYLVARSRQANAGANNGTFSITGVPEVRRPPAFVFDGRVREGRTVSIFGPGSAGKTTIVDGLIASACSGREIIPGWVPTRPFGTMILDWDEGEDEELVRLGAICRAYGVELSAGYHYKRQTRPLHDVADEIGAFVVDNKVELAVVSPVGRAARNMGDNITAPIDELYEILRSFGTTNILIDHVTGENMKGGAQREFGSVRKRDNARGSYSLYAQSEDVGVRVVVMKNTKPDALAPKLPDQAVRIEYDPPMTDSGVYDTISFFPDEVREMLPSFADAPVNENAMRSVLHRALQGTDGVANHLTHKELAETTGYKESSVRVCLYRYRDSWFGRLPSGRWEALPIPSV